MPNVKDFVHILKRPKKFVKVLKTISICFNKNLLGSVLPAAIRNYYLRKDEGI